MTIFAGPQFLLIRELPLGSAFLYTVVPGKAFFQVKQCSLKLTQVEFSFQNTLFKYVIQPVNIKNKTEFLYG